MVLLLSVKKATTPLSPCASERTALNAPCSPFVSPASVSRSPLAGIQIKSPNSGGLRLGLSRNRRGKPLHSNVKIV